MIAIDYPTITVGERTLVVRYSLAAQVLMGRRGIDICKLGEMLAPTNPSGPSNMLQVFAACVAENFTGDSPETFSLDRTPTADYWATQLSHLQFREVDRVLGEAMGKAMEELRAAAGPPKLVAAS